jgi:hypothetical protein
MWLGVAKRAYRYLAVATGKFGFSMGNSQFTSVFQVGTGAHESAVRAPDRHVYSCLRVYADNDFEIQSIVSAA